MAVKILVADDSATMRKILEMTFAGEDAQVVVVNNAEAAVAAAREMRPDVVFCDASMSPDGYEVTRAIKHDASLASTAVIILASQHTPFDATKARDAGVDDHVSKPFDTQALIDKVAQVMARPRAAAAGAPAGRPMAPAQPPVRPVPIAAAPPTVPKSSKSTVVYGAPPGPSAPAAAAAPPRPPAPPQPPPRPVAAERPMLQLADEEAAAAAPTPARAQPHAAPAAARPAPAAAPAARPAAPARVSSDNGGGMADKLRALGLTPEQVDGVLALSREVIEQVVWEVVPDLAETIIREEIKRLTTE